MGLRMPQRPKRSVAPSQLASIPAEALEAGALLQGPASPSHRDRLAAGARLAGRSPGAALAIVVLVILVVVAIFAPAIAPHDPQESFDQHLREAPSSSFPLGTDELGRDVLSRVMHGGRLSLRVGLTTTGLALGAGLLLALLATMTGRIMDALVMRVTDMMLAFPGILLALAVVAVLGPGLDYALAAVAISLVPGYVRTVRALILGVREREFVQAARIMGASRLYIAWRHLVPNIVAGLIVLATLGVALVTLEVSALSFIGLGAQPPTAEWGSMLASARSYLDSAWWMAVFPGLAITVTVLAINTAGDWLRDVFDPRVKK
jgi:dipeptide transport system permease protein